MAPVTPVAMSILSGLPVWLMVIIGEWRGSCQEKRGATFVFQIKARAAPKGEQKIICSPYPNRVDGLGYDKSAKRHSIPWSPRVFEAQIIGW